MPVVCYRIQKAQNMLPGGSVEAIREHCVCGSPVLRQLDLGIVDDKLARVLYPEFATNLHWDFDWVIHRIKHCNSSASRPWGAFTLEG